MDLSIIICTYNRFQRLYKTLESLECMIVPEVLDWEVLVVDNNSNDKTKEVVEESARKGILNLKYLFEAMQGKSFALNRGLESTKGEIIAFTDDDVIVDKGWIREMVKALGKYPEYNCFGGKVVAVYPEDMPRWLDIEGSMKFLKSVFVDRDDGDLEVEYGINTISRTPGGCNMFFRKEAMKKKGLFRTDLGPVGTELGFSEDTEYCQRLLEKGERFMYIPSAIVYHPVHPERLYKKYLLRWQYKCGRSEVRRSGGYKNTLRVFGVSRYLFRKFLHHVMGWGLSVQSKKRLYHKLRLYYTAGEIVEHLRVGFKRS